MDIGLALCKAIKKGQSKGMSMKQIARANPGLWRQSVIDQARDDFFVSNLHFSR